MEILFALSVLGMIVMSCIAFVVGKKTGNKGESKEKVSSLESRLSELSKKVVSQETTINEQIEKITNLTSERDVQRVKAEQFEKQLSEKAQSNEKQLEVLHDAFEKEKIAIKERNDKSISDLK
jgi:hypothetical protein